MERNQKHVFLLWGEELRQEAAGAGIPKRLRLTHIARYASPAATLPPGAQLCGGPAPHPAGAPTLTQCWCCTSHTCAAWLAWPGPWRQAGRTGGSVSWVERQEPHLDGGDRHMRAPPRQQHPGCIPYSPSTSPNTASRRLIKGALTTDPKVALGAMGRGSVHASFWAEAGQVQGAPGRPS